jgi:hypothetical protein
LGLTLHLLLFTLHLPLVRLKCGQSILQETAAVGPFASLIANTKPSVTLLLMWSATTNILFSFE